jgi:biotin carboxyl carrier protein
MSAPLELIPDRRPPNGHETLRLCSPEVGLFTRALPPGALLAPGAPAGLLYSLGRRIELVVPSGVHGRVTNARPQSVHAPVGYGTVLYELAPLAGGTGAPEVPSASVAAGALLFRAPHSGRFWQRAAPGEPPFVQAGTLLEEGRTVGLVEVMKTFAELHYRAGGELPARARVVRLLAADGAEVEQGSALLELERA